MGWDRTFVAGCPKVCNADNAAAAQRFSEVRDDELADSVFRPLQKLLGFTSKDIGQDLAA